MEDENQTLTPTDHQQQSVDEEMTDVIKNTDSIIHAQNPNSDDDDDDDDDVSSDSEAESEEQKLQLLNLETELLTNPSNYDTHIQEWAKDEASLSSGPDAVSAVKNLYERGVSDYLSVPLWCDYLNFIQEYDTSVSNCTPDGIAKEKEKQIQRVRSLFHRQLSIPLTDLRSTLLAYKSWEAEQGTKLDAESSDLDGVPPKAASAYKKALEMYEARDRLEEQISNGDQSDSEKLQKFLGYLKYEQSSGHPTRVQVLFERAITEFPVSTDLWIDYSRYMDKTFKVGKMVRDVYFRATRNCPWVGELWVRYLLLLERGRAPEKEIADLSEKAMQCTFSTVEEYLDLFLTRVDGLRRRMSLPSKSEDLLDYSIIRETFQRASEYLSPLLSNSDQLLHFYVYWARLELKLGKDLAGSRGIWESLLKACGSMFEAWQAYIAMEIELDHLNEARSLYKRCYCKRFGGTGSEDICHSWLRFEREFGALEDYDHALQKVTPRLEELQLFRLQQQQSFPVAESAYKKENVPKKNAREKRKSGSNLNGDESPAKKQKATAHNLKKGNEKDKAQQSQKSVEVNKGKEVQDKEKRKEEKNDQQKKDPFSGKKRLYTDQCTVFISNIDLKAKEEDLEKFFKDIGGVSSIRILIDKFTRKSRGLAYVDFADDERVAKAIAKNRETLFGKKLSIARSDPNGRKSYSGHGTPTRRDGGTSNSRENDYKEVKEASKDTAATPRNDVQLKGKNTFAVPRNFIKPLGWTSNKPGDDKGKNDSDEQPKSNDEFRKMLIQK
ncbi:hypothetical protein ACFE04_023773 [Oxalis oulophora]